MNAMFEKGLIKIAIFLVLLTLFISFAVWIYGKYKVESNKHKCQARTRALTLFLFIRKGKDTELLQETDLSKVVNPPSLATCVCSGKHYVYKAFKGPVNFSTPDRVIMWCPTPCHGGGRIVWWENGASMWVPESYFQNIMQSGGRHKLEDVPPHKGKKWPK